MVTFATYFFLSFFLIWRLESFLDNSKQESTNEVVQIDLIGDQAHILSQEKFKFLITSNKPIPTKIGQWKAYKGYKTIENGYEFLKEDIPMRNCSYLYED